MATEEIWLNHMHDTINTSPKAALMDKSEWPLVSIVMPAYNHEKYVESAIRSVWSLDYRPIELIVLNDGSTDSTLTIIRRLEQDSPIKMTVIDKANEGICKTLNLGILLASGKYVGILASDDEYVPERMTTHVRLLEAIVDPSVAGCYGQQRIINERGEVTVGVVNRKMVFPDLLIASLECKQPFSLQSSTFKTDVIKQLGFDESLFFEDWDFFIRLTSKYKFLYSPGVSFRYRGHEGGINRNMERMADSRMAIFDKHKSDPRVTNYGINKFRSHIELINSHGYFLVGNFRDARKWLFRSWLSWPTQFILSIPLTLKLLIGEDLVNLARKLKYSLRQYSIR